MFGAIARKLFGSANDRMLRGMHKTVAEINALEGDIAKLSDAELTGQTDLFRARLAKGETLDDILPEAFATVREASRRELGLRPFDVQLIGGLTLHQGRIAEMKTGEGKTLVATLACYLNALEGKGVHVVTVNDYLARRDSEWMGRLYGRLGLSTGVIVHGLNDVERKAAYACDITYATNNELGFDYLRDNMKFRLDDMVQRPFSYAIVDEVDSILVDEARTPLIISGPAEDSSELYKAIDVLIPRLKPEDYEKDEKARTVAMTEAGQEHIDQILREVGLLHTGALYDVSNVNLVHHVNQALKAHKLFTRDVDYIVKDNKVIIIDEFTGRMMEGRRYSEGLHQALEAKENAAIQMENQTLASITFQNYFRMYPKLSGMTGTAMTEAAEFAEIYNLDVLEIPTNVVVKRQDHDDEIYRTEREKFDAIVTLVKECSAREQPVLVGTVSIEKSEKLAAALKAAGIPHNVLNARHHEQEAFIIAQAGRPGAVTIATNMAGRGTDIKLGGNLEMRTRLELSEVTDPDERARRLTALEAEIEVARQKVLVAGGLYVIGTERHESRRIDNQLRGRSGRQGDPGASKFFLSLEDDLMRIFATDRLDGMLKTLGLKEGEPIIHRWVTKALEKAQQKVEGRNFEIRKNLLKFDNVMNDQRKVIYEQRREIMQLEDAASMVADMRHDVVQNLVTTCIPPNAYAEKWDIATLHTEVLRVLNLDLPLADWAKEEGIADEEILERIMKAAEETTAAKETEYGANIMRLAEKSLLLQVLDQLWKDHLLSLDHLRQGIGLRAYAQRDPLNEYKREAFTLFEDMLARLREQTTAALSHMMLQMQTPESAMFGGPSGPAGEEFHGNPDLLDLREADGMIPYHGTRIDPANPASWNGLSRNAPCPCGSGKKYKHCHGVA